MAKDLERVIANIVAGASSAMAREIAAAVRGAMGSQGATAPVKRGPGRPSKAPPAPAPPAGRGRRAGRRRTVSDGELSQVLAVLARKPGLTSVEIQREAGIDSKQASRVLVKLRKLGRVKWKGARSAARYTAIGAMAAPEPATRGKRASKKVAARAPSAAKRQSRVWPTCKVAGCGRPMFGPSSDRQLCYSHYQKTGGKHYRNK